MPVQPAFEIDLEHDGLAVTLKASLRAAAAVDNMPGGIAGAYEGLLNQSLTSIRQVLLATATDRLEALHFLSATAGKPLSRFIPDAQAACLAVLAALFFNECDDSADEAPSQGSENKGAAMPLREYFQTLYRYATGWLGWSPSETWNASPTEIEAAFTAHVDRLIKLTPGLSSEDKAKASNPPDSYTPERLAEIEEQGMDPAFDREGLRRLKARYS